MAKAPKVAIITRTKNRSLFLERAVKSVLAQTERDFVHVILNDGGSKKDLESLLIKHPDQRRIVIHNDSSVGIVRALNQAIQASNSKYIAILDDDDTWHKDRLKLGLEAIESHGAKASVVPMEIVFEELDNSVIVERSRMPHPESWSGEISLYKQCHRNFLSNGALMYERSIYEELGGYDETLLTAEDWDFGIRLMLKHDVEQVISENPLVYYHQRPNVKSGETGNSVHAGVREQERTINIIRNRYLRNDINSGKFGVGFIMNDAEQSLNNVVRIEGHINRSVVAIDETIHKSVDKYTEKILVETRTASIYSTIKHIIAGRRK